MSDKLVLKGLKVKYKAVSVKHLHELQLDIDKLEQEGKITKNKVIRGYIADFKFKQLEDFPEAKYLIAIAIEGKVALVDFHFKGTKHEIMIPPNYLTTNISDEELTDFILAKIIKNKDYRVERTGKVHLKRLLARSGLGKYGRNNICYVDELGSLGNLFCFFTDYEFAEDNWSEVTMLEQCENCSICIKKCPTQAITQENFVIDVERCIPLYNEIEGDFPTWIPKDAHNALIGCMKCQMFCPANKVAMKNTQRFEDITEEETEVLLAGKGDENIIASIDRKLDMYHPQFVKYSLPVMQRNLSVIVK
ncbi:MAG: 4Fe-4S double cluster binding domain-containing protein [Candidatus Heimdallarchaeota archaeon]